MAATCRHGQKAVGWAWKISTNLANKRRPKWASEICGTSVAFVVRPPPPTPCWVFPASTILFLFFFFNFGFYVVPRIVLIRCGIVRPALDRQIAWGKINERQLVLVGRGKQTNDWQKCLQFNVELERSRTGTKHKKKKTERKKKSLDHLYVPLLVLFC